MVARERAGESGEDKSTLVRLAAVAAVLAAVAVVALLLFAEDGEYTVTASFYSSSQLVEGNDVRMGGVPVGSVDSLDLGPNGLARVTMSIDEDAAPLDRGTQAIIRQTSLSGIANRFVDLQLPGGATGQDIPDGGEIAPENSKASVEIDSVLNTFRPETREAVRRFVQGSAQAIDGRGDELHEAYRYLAPALSSSRRVFSELSADRALLDRFVVDSARLVTTVADRRQDLSELVANLNTTTRAAGAEREALSEALALFPDFMRRANTTFVNLRGTLDELDPLVDAGEPAAARLREFLPELRSFASDARPTVRDLARTIRDPGPRDDLVDLLRTFPPLTDVAVETARRNGERRPGSLPQTTQALRESTPVIGFGRPYTADFLGWFDDFSHSGSYDAIGGFSRSQIYVNLFSVNVPPLLPEVLDPQERLAQFTNTVRSGQYKRCPGHADAVAADGSNVYTPEQVEQFDCIPTHRAVGQVGGE